MEQLEKLKLSCEDEIVRNKRIVLLEIAYRTIIKKVFSTNMLHSVFDIIIIMSPKAFKRRFFIFRVYFFFFHFEIEIIFYCNNVYRNYPNGRT